MHFNGLGFQNWEEKKKKRHRESLSVSVGCLNFDSGRLRLYWFARAVVSK